MRILKYLALGASLLLLVAVVAAHLQRERLAREIANRILAGSGFELTDIGIAHLGTNPLRLSRITIIGEDGSEYVAQGVNLRFELADRRVTNVSIERLSIRPASRKDQADVSELLDQALNLSRLAPGLEVTLGHLSHPALPGVERLRWQASDATQVASMLIDGINLSAGIETRSASEYRIELAAGPGSPSMIVIGLELERLSNGYDVTGEVRLVTDVLLAHLRERNLVVANEVSIAGIFRGSVSAAIETGAAGDIKLDIAADETGKLELDYRLSPHSGLAFATSDLRIETIELGFPEFEWRIAFGTFSGSVSSDYSAAANLTVDALECASGIRCAATVDLRARQLNIENYRAALLEVSGTATVFAEDDMRASLVPASFVLEDIAGDGWQVGMAELEGAKSALLSMDADDTVVEADSMAFRIERMALPDDLVTSADVVLRSLRYSLRQAKISTEFSIPKAGTTINRGQTRITPFGMEGNFEFFDDRGALSTEIRDAARGLLAEVAVDFRPEETAFRLGKLEADFAAAPLSASLGEWPYEWDIVSGTTMASGQLVSSGDRGPQGSAGTFDISLENIAGNVGDIGATGASGRTRVELRPGLEPRIGPGNLQVGLLDVGLPIRDIRASVDWDTASDFALVDDLRMELLGGTARADHFRVDVSNLDTTIDLQIDDVQLGLIAQLAEFDDIELSGALSGMIPVRMTNGQLTVEDGKLRSLPPGGVIRYHSQPADQASSLGLAQRALSNLQYERLSSDVAYTPGGDLKLKMRLEGINPDLDPLQPVILNLGVENNIPQLLRSLQATRDIEAILESRTRQ